MFRCRSAAQTLISLLRRFWENENHAYPKYQWKTRPFVGRFQVSVHSPVLTVLEEFDGDLMRCINKMQCQSWK
jgi:hypothetical protein